MSVDRLFVIWCEARGGTRCVVGHLARSPGGFEFWYEQDLADARRRGFRLLPEFPEHRASGNPYRARYLFSSFATRLPSPGRSDTPELLERWGVTNPDDQMEVLARSGGLRVTDSLELAEYRSMDDSLSTPLEFRVAGSRYVAGQPDIAAGELLRLIREPDNAFDTCATIVAARTNQPIGYVPRQYSPLFSRLLDAGVFIQATAIRRIDVPEDGGRWVIGAVRIVTADVAPMH